MERFPALLLLALAAGAADKPAPPAITLHDRHGHVTPQRHGFQHTGGGNIDVSQSTADTVVFTMTGVAVAGAHPCRDSRAAQEFDLEQCLEITGGKKVKVTLEARVIGLLRSHGSGCGVAEESAACATLVGDGADALSVCAPAHSVTGGEHLSLNDHAGPVSVTLPPGRYTLHQTFQIAVHHPHALAPCKAASAEFAPDPALDPLWISAFEPFHGAIKKDFGFQVTLKVTNE